MNKKKILILGCGWSGSLTADLYLGQGHSVWATTTQETKVSTLEKKGIQVKLLDFSKNTSTEPISKLFGKETFDQIIISVPVRRNENPDLCQEKFTRLSSFLSGLSANQLIFLSSIGIYESKNGSLNETSEIKQQSTIFQTEQQLNSNFPNLIILRLGGLFGFGRIPGRYFSQKTTSIGNEKANYLHGTDLSNLLFKLSMNEIPPGTYNVVAPEHPLKRDVYTKMSQKYGFLPVLFEEASCVQKEVSSKKLMEALPFNFSIPSPLDF